LAEVIRPWAPTARGKYFVQVLVETKLKSESFEPLIPKVCGSKVCGKETF